MIKKMILLILSLSICMQNVFAVQDCEKHPIYCTIKNIYKGIDNSFAMKLSNVVYNYSKNLNIEPYLIIAILAQESKFKVEAKNCLVAYVEKIPYEIAQDEYYCDNQLDKEKCYSGLSKWKKVKACTDFGIGQLTAKNIDRMGLSVDKLINDLEYSMKHSMDILKGVRKYREQEPSNWWTRYNGDFGNSREIYKKDVCKYYYGSIYCGKFFKKSLSM